MIFDEFGKPFLDLAERPWDGYYYFGLAVALGDPYATQDFDIETPLGPHNHDHLDNWCCQ